MMDEVSGLTESNRRRQFYHLMHDASYGPFDFKLNHQLNPV